jgi:hypothetical protein
LMKYPAGVHTQCLLLFLPIHEPSCEIALH